MAKKNYPYYRLKLNKHSEWHLFGVQNVINAETGEKKFLIESQSICGKMNKRDKLDGSDRLKSQPMREYSASIGKQVCGSCISHLYLTVKK